MNLVFGKETFDCIWQAGKEREVRETAEQRIKKAKERRAEAEINNQFAQDGFRAGFSFGRHLAYQQIKEYVMGATDAEWDEAQEINRFIDAQRNSAECHDSQFDGAPGIAKTFGDVFGLVFVGVGCDCGCAQCETWGSRPEDV